MLVTISQRTVGNLVAFMLKSRTCFQLCKPLVTRRKEQNFIQSRSSGIEIEDSWCRQHLCSAPLGATQCVCTPTKRWLQLSSNSVCTYGTIQYLLHYYVLTLGHRKWHAMYLYCRFHTNLLTSKAKLFGSP